VLGDVRRVVELARLAAVLWPLWAVLVVAVAFGVTVALVAAGTVLVAAQGHARRWASRARWWWSWRWDARAAGLVALAERRRVPDVTYDANAPALEVVPRLVTLTITGPVRAYTVRPLPGQTLTSFTEATEALRWRWRAVQVTAAPHPDRRGLVVVEVVTGAGIDAPTTHPDVDPGEVSSTATLSDLAALWRRVRR
jgi:hypothetical protein